MRKLIGKGAFTKAYQVGPNEVEVISTCPAKECYALFSQGNPLAPVIERIETNVFKMPLYPKLKKPTAQFNADALKTYRVLRSLSCTVHSYYEFCDSINETELPDDVKENIVSLAGDVCNAIDCGNMRFECSPRNVTHDEAGNLIMLDCFFCIETLASTKGWN